MTPSLRLARTCTAAATACAAAGMGLGVTGQAWPCGISLYAASFLAWCAVRARGRHRLILGLHAQALRAALGQPAPGEDHFRFPCCAFWQHSDGVVHGADCTRRPDADDELTAACCAVWFVSRSTDHAPTCAAGFPATGRSALA